MARTSPSPKQPSRAGAVSTQLRRYHAKRDLTASGEPAERPAAPAKVAHFVIQKHDASHLHYDFRLEMEGVLRSWAVPKGLRDKPGERSLAIEVEDHPLSYGSFEGTIPAGNYGAGTVMLWDRGVYVVEGGSPARAYHAGKIHLALAGEKCQGEWTLVRLPSNGKNKNHWLMIKNTDRQKRSAIRKAGRDLSVATGRSMEEIARRVKKASGKLRTSVSP